MAEDGVLPTWFRDPHHKYGSTHRLINVIAGLQLVTIIASQGNVYVLGEAYAFGVIWSFAMKALAFLVLRFTEPEIPRWRVSGNVRILGLELPVGLILITVALFMLAGINLLTKRLATVSGGIFTVILFVAFTMCERYYKLKKADHEDRTLGQMEEAKEERFHFMIRDHLSPKSLSIRPGNTLVAVHDPNNLRHLQKILEAHDPTTNDVVVLSVNPNVPEEALEDNEHISELMNECESQIFSKVVYVAEKVGKPVALVAIPGRNPYYVILRGLRGTGSGTI